MATGIGAGARVMVLCLWLAPLFPASAEPPGWTAVPINDRKPRTDYRTDARGEDLVLARADRAASLLMRSAGTISLHATPWLEWSWQLLQAPDDADIATAEREDAAARIVLVFDGDRSRLPWTDRSVMALADRLGSRPMPYATLMYVASARHPVETVVPNPYTRRVRMIVVDAEPATSPPSWRGFRRDVVADFRRAFGEPPGPLVAWGLLSDSDNTASRAEAIYRTPRFVAAPR